MGTENIRPKGVKIMLDRERRMRFTFAAVEYLTEKYGELNTAFASMGEVAQGKINQKTVGAIIDFAYAGLMSDDRNLTREDVADLIDMASIGELARCIALAVNGSMPKSEESENPPTPAA